MNFLDVLRRLAMGDETTQMRFLCLTCGRTETVTSTSEDHSWLECLECGGKMEAVSSDQ